MNSSLESLIKNLPEDKFKYLSQVFCGNKLEPQNKKEYIQVDIWIALKDLIK